MEDVWVWDKNRPSRIIPKVEIYTTQDVTVEILKGRRGRGAPARATRRSDAAGDRRRQHPDPGRGVPGRRAAARVAHLHRARGHRRRAGRRPRPDPAPARRQPGRARRAWSSPRWSRRCRPGYRSLSLKYLGRAALWWAPACARGCRSPSTTPTSSGPTGIVNAVAALRRYGGPCIVVDFGTATTFDAVSAAGEYLGGAIAPASRPRSTRSPAGPRAW